MHRHAITLTAYRYLIEGKDRQAAEVMELTLRCCRQNENIAGCQSEANSEIDAQKAQFRKRNKAGLAQR